MRKDKKRNSLTRPVGIVLLILAFIAIYYYLPHFSNFHQTLQVLRHSSLLWILLAIIATGFTFWSAAIVQFAAGNSAGTITDILSIQLAGFLINHFLPFSLGGIGMTEEYYHKLGQDRSKALIYVTIPIAFGFITTVALIIVVSPATLIQLVYSFHNNRTTRLIIAVIAALLVMAIFTWPFYEQRFKKTYAQAVLGLRSIRSSRQLSIITVGSFAITLFSAVTLLASVEAVHAHVTLVAIILLYVTASFVSSIAPTPDGLGATEAALVFGLTRAGVGLPQAVAATLVYRLITFWLPIAPGMLSLHLVNRRAFSPK